MWITGVIISVILVYISGMAYGLSHRILFHPETLPWWMQTSFWLFYGNDKNKPGRLRRYKDYDPEKGARFFGSRGIFIAFTNGYHMCTSIHGIFLTMGAMLWGISVFFYAPNPSFFIHAEAFILLFIYLIRCAGKLTTYSSRLI